MKELIQLWENIKQFLGFLHKEKQPYNITVQLYNLSQIIPVVRGCTGFMFTNVGDDAATINGMSIFPGTIGTVLGDSRSIGAHKNDVYKGIIKLSFAGVGANPSVEIVQVFYTDVN